MISYTYFTSYSTISWRIQRRFFSCRDHAAPKGRLMTTTQLSNSLGESPSWVPYSRSAVKELTTFYKTRGFIATLSHWTISWTSCTQSSNPIYTYVSGMVCLFPSGFFSKSFSHLTFPNPIHLIPCDVWFHHPNNMYWKVKTKKVLIMESSLFSCYFLSRVQIFSSAFSFQTTLSYFTPLERETKFHTRIKNK
jgi:hypothetical protein